MLKLTSKFESTITWDSSLHCLDPYRRLFIKTGEDINALYYVTIALLK